MHSIPPLSLLWRHPADPELVLSGVVEKPATVAAYIHQN